MTLWVFADNAPALAFYRRYGLQADGAEQEHESGGQREIRLRVSLRA